MVKLTRRTSKNTFKNFIHNLFNRNYTKFTTILIILVLGFGFTNSNELDATTDTYFKIIRPLFTGETAFETTAFVAQFWRVAGNFGFNESVNRISSKLKEAGYVLESKAIESDRFTYRIEERLMKNPTWEPIEAQLSIVGAETELLNFETNRNMIFQNSPSTPKGGIIAEVIHVKNLQSLKNRSVKGKIVYAEMSPNRLFNEAILEGGAIGIITYDNPDYLQPEKNKTSIQFRQLQYVKGSSDWGIALSFEANKTLKSAISKGQIQLKVNVQTKVYPSTELTVVATIKGSELPKESLVFSAHIQEPGANDNATGVGVQLEMSVLSAKLIKGNKIEAKRSLVFLWGDEIVSTRRYIQEKEKRTSEINWGFSLDMVGENTELTGGSFLIEKMPDPSAIWTRGKDKHSEWGGAVLSVSDMKPHYLNDFIINVFKGQGAYANWEVNTNPFEGGSDHTPFLKNEIPGLLLWHFTDQFYHTDNDRIDKVSKETLKNVGIAALASAYTLINADQNTAKQFIETILKFAKVRMKDEFELSKLAIEKGGTYAYEKKILKTWADWYYKALQSVDDLVLEAASIQNEINEAQNFLNMITDNYISELKEL